MNVKTSSLDFRKFVVLGSFFEAIPFDEGQEDLTLPEIPLDVEIDILKNPEDEALYNMVLEVSGNREEERLPGYSFQVACEGVFGIDGHDDLEKKTIDQFLLYSAVPMLISSLRGYLLNVSSYSIYGQYLLPAVDLQDLIKKKAKKQKSKE